MVKAPSLGFDGFETVEEVYQPITYEPAFTPPPPEPVIIQPAIVEPVREERFQEEITAPAPQVVEVPVPAYLEPAVVVKSDKVLEPVISQPDIVIQPEVFQPQKFDAPVIYPEIEKTETEQPRSRPVDFLEPAYTPEVVEVPEQETKTDMDPATIGAVIGLTTSLIKKLRENPAEFKLDSPDKAGENYRLIHVPSNTVIAEEYPENVKKVYGALGGLGWTGDAKQIVIDNGKYSTLLLLQKKNLDPMSFQSFIDGITQGVQTFNTASTAAQNTWGVLSGIANSFMPGSGGGGSSSGNAPTAPSTDWTKILLIVGGVVVAIVLLPKLLFRRRR